MNAEQQRRTAGRSAQPRRKGPTRNSVRNAHIRAGLSRVGRTVVESVLFGVGGGDQRRFVAYSLERAEVVEVPR